MDAPGAETITASCASVPDAACPLYVDTLQGTSGRARQRSRRSHILASARRLLSQKGYDGLSIQDLACDLHISKQTIYNLIGTKREVTSTAIVDHLAWMAAAVREMDRSGNMVLSMVDLYCANFRRNASYTRQASLAMFQRDRALCAEIRAKQQAWFHGWLRHHYEQGCLRDDVDLDMLARQLVVLNEGNMLDWANGLCTEEELIRSLIASHGLMLRGASTRAEEDKVDAWMQARYQSVATGKGWGAAACPSP